MTMFLSYLWEYYVEVSFYFTLGLVFVAIFQLLLTKEMVLRHLSGRWSCIKATALGIPLPLCSCGVIPTAKFLQERGASKGAVASFLISTPMTGVDSVTMYYGILGPFAAVFRVLSALITGVLGGFFMERHAVSQREGRVQDDDRTPKESRKALNWPNIQEAFNYSFVRFLNSEMSMRYICGVILGASVGFFLPDNLLENSVLQLSFFSHLFMLVLGLPLYVCATASVPLAYSLLLKGLSIGDIFVFLTAGPVFNVSAMVMLRSIFTRRELCYYVGFLIVASMLTGYAADFLYQSLGVSELAHPTKQHSHHSILDYGIALFLMIFLLKPLIRRMQNALEKWKIKGRGAAMTFIKVPDMECHDCKNRLEACLQKAGILGSVDLRTKKVFYPQSLRTQDIDDIIRKAGFNPKEEQKLR